MILAGCWRVALLGCLQLEEPTVGHDYCSMRGEAIRLRPLLTDPSGWLAGSFDWESAVIVVDYFAGAGGLSLGLSSVDGLSVVATFELDELTSRLRRNGPRNS
jgi:hypothetical protein